jgi:hypothetical protein
LLETPVLETLVLETLVLETPVLETQAKPYNQISLSPTPHSP